MSDDRQNTTLMREEKHEWRVILEFLRETDPVLLKRISRKLVNHLSWSGVHEARELLQQSAPTARSESDSNAEENRPLRRSSSAAGDLASEAFRIAKQHLSDSTILELITTWIKEDKASFLVRALEEQETPLGDIIVALERFHHTGIEESELSRPTQKGLHVSLIRRFFSDNVNFINVAEEYVKVKDFYDLLGNIVFPRQCHGKLGGKSAGIFLAKRILERCPEASEQLRRIKVPKTWHLSSDWILHFVHHNDLEEVLNRKYYDIEQIRDEYPHLVALFKDSSFPTEMINGLALALDSLGTSPLIVRSSSLLEDRSDSSFSGKYKSLFLGNQGTKQERLAALMDAVAEVYASIFGPDPTEYRAERGLLHVHEEMGVMIQEVVGKKAGKYFLPSCSGVAFSNNEFRWSPRIKRGDGLVRMVPGLGTRAVDRVGDDYPVLLAPGLPGLRANVTIDEIIRYSPKRIDVINLETNEFETVDAAALVKEVGNEYPALAAMVSLVNDDRIEQPVAVHDLRDRDVVFTFEGLIRHSPFVSQIRELMALLQAKLKTPVDIEFAYDGTDLYLLQCRPEIHNVESAPATIPLDLPPERVLFSSRKFVSNGRIPDATHIVYVTAEGYSQLDTAQMREVGRAVGKLNKLLPRREFILMGPGRWGSRGDIRLGVPVTYSDINNAAMLIEVARQKGHYVPDLSFGTHFFQDLVEAQIRYLPLYPDDAATSFQEEFLLQAHNSLRDLLPEYAHLAEAIKVIDVAAARDGQVLRVLTNAECEQAVAFFAPRSAADHWVHALATR